jgi:hypothetical protein
MRELVSDDSATFSSIRRRSCASKRSIPISFADCSTADQTAQSLRLLPVGVTLANEPLAPEVIAKLIRMTGGNFRLLIRILTQIERVLDVNQLHTATPEVVEAARDSLVIGQG